MMLYDHKMSYYDFDPSDVISALHVHLGRNGT